MIFNVQKNLYASVEDAIIRSAVGEIVFKIAKLKKGYYIYNKEAEQLGQILFDKNIARITIAEQGTVALEKTGDTFRIYTPALSKEEQALKKFQLVDKTEYTLVGDFKTPIYDLYADGKNVLNVLPDNANQNFFRVRVKDDGNLILLVMIAVAVNKLWNDPESKL